MKNDVEMEEGEPIVEEILDKRIVKKGKLEYLITTYCLAASYNFPWSFLTLLWLDVTLNIYGYLCDFVSWMCLLLW